MPRFATGVVSQVLAQRPGLARLIVRVADADRPATAFTNVIGPVRAGDRVVVNTVAAELGLGSGSQDFVLWNLERTSAGSPSGGHILKLRYTPWQIDTLVAEAPESDHHQRLEQADDVEAMPVVACGVHSQLPAVVAVLKSRHPGIRIAYLMTDGAALPLAHSDLVAALQDRGLVDVTLTCGHAFGGNLECVNVFSGLTAARFVAAADVTVVGMGPGIVGTDTVLGHTGMEQGQVLDAATSLGGRAIATLRISFADPRERHRLVSHHSLSALRYGAVARATIAVPDLGPDRTPLILQSLARAGLTQRHDIRVVGTDGVLAALDHFGLAPRTMGRSVADDPAFHLAAGAAGILAADAHDPATERPTVARRPTADDAPPAQR